MPLSPAQCRAARALLGWSQDQLAAASQVAKATIAHFEASNRSPYDRTLGELEAAFVAAGVDLIAEDEEGGGGVRLQGRRPLDEGRRPEELNATNDD